MSKYKIKSEIKWWRQKFVNVYHLAVSMYWTIRCGYPAKKMLVVGVTGTDGKTTTCTLLYEVLKAGKIRAGMLTTVAARYVGESGQEAEIDTGLHTTNPDARQLQPILKTMAEAGVTHLVLEVTAHGIDQYRVWGTNIQIGVLTNVTHEHLDDFVNMDRYAATKQKMFKGVRWAVLNSRGMEYGEFARRAAEFGAKVVGYRGVSFKEINPALSGEYNRENLGAVAAVSKILGIPDGIVKSVAKTFAGVEGRRQEVVAGQKFRVVVDFAHTPNALFSVLTQLKEEVFKGGKLVVVFGCTGERDREKRPKMGKIAADLADVAIVTSDDARSENQDEIYWQIEAGIGDAVLKRKQGRLFQENDRRKAVELAVRLAKPGDIVLLAGKGHEKSILIGKVEQPWSDAEVIREIILKTGRF